MDYEKQVELAEQANKEIVFPTPEHKIVVSRSRAAARRGKPGRFFIKGPYVSYFRDLMHDLGAKWKDLGWEVTPEIIEKLKEMSPLRQVDDWED